MESVTLGSQGYDVYANVSTADLYLNAASHADSWREEIDQDVKARYLVTATRLLDRQTWKTEYNTQALRFVEQNIIDASIELALTMYDGSDVQERQNMAALFRSISAGSVSITNFRGVETATRFPQIVQELLKDYLGGSGTGYFSIATGVDGEATFPIDLGFNRGI